jgi:hypothetical protein
MKEYDMDMVRVVPVIITTTERWGKGTKESPVRVITQIYTLEGELIAYKDPCHSKPR